MTTVISSTFENYWQYQDQYFAELECGPVPNVMAALLNIGGTLYSTLQSLADAHY